MYKKLVTKQPNIYLHYETILIINPFYTRLQIIIIIN